ncbi:hypothetical protein Golomagni_05278 [Golovinomyces magnicellulatus]|nr:hypothetical protein Golomagni_05278 [Golovinomyces magnicellulatus]
MYSFVEKIGILALIAFSQPTFSFPHIRRQDSSASCIKDTNSLALSLQNLIITQNLKINNVNEMISDISSVTFDQVVFEDRKFELVKELKNAISIRETRERIQIENKLLSTSVTKLIELQDTQSTVVQKLGSSNIDTDSAKESLNELLVSLKSCVEQSQKVLQLALSLCSNSIYKEIKVLPSIYTKGSLSNTSSNKDLTNTDDNEKNDNKNSTLLPEKGVIKNDA